MKTKQKIHFLALCCVADANDKVYDINFYTEALQDLFEQDRQTFDSMYNEYKEDAFSSLFPEYRNFFYEALDYGE